MLKHLNYKNILGQWCVLQVVEEDEDPAQLFPEYWGAGLVHVRDLAFVPPPHVTVHDPQDAHAAQLPCTEIIYMLFMKWTIKQVETDV